MFYPKLDILPPPQRILWNELKTTPDSFVLYGGTALALRLGHRQSEDFDFFSTDPFDPDDLLSRVPYLRNAVPVQSVENTLTCIAERRGRIKISFFGRLDLQRVQDPDIVEGVCIASLIDLAGTKMGVVQQRAETKDYIDIAAILRSGVTLPMALSAARAVYGPRFDPRITARALTSFEDGNLKQLDATTRKELASAVSMFKLDQLKSLTSKPDLSAREKQS